MAPWDSPLEGHYGTLKEFARDPRGYVLGIVLTFIVGGLLDGFAYLAGVVEEIWRQVTDSLVSAFDPLFAGGGTIAAAIAAGIRLINGALVEVVSVAGPAAPIVAMLFWVAVGIAVAFVIRRLIQVIPWVIPWM